MRCRGTRESPDVLDRDWVTARQAVGPLRLTHARMQKSNSGYGPELQLFRYYGKRAVDRRGLVLLGMNANHMTGVSVRLLPFTKASDLSA